MADDVVLEPTPATQFLIDLIDSQVEASTGEGVATRNNDSPTKWIGEDASSLAVDEKIIYRLRGYKLSYVAEPCASYEVSLSMEVTADGPDLGSADNMFMGVVDATDDPLAGGTYEDPAGLGESITMSEQFEVSPEQLNEGLYLGYGATTHQAGIQSGYTFSEPTAAITEDLANCDLDGDGVADDIDPDNTDFCVPDGHSTACVAASATTPPTSGLPITDVTSSTTTPAPLPPADAPDPRAPKQDASGGMRAVGPPPLRPTG